jgi:polysaccharide biosynthesis transport protein
MTITQLLSIFGARWRSALIGFGAVIALVAAFTSYIPKQYTASAAVLLDVKSPDPIAGVVLPGMIATGYMATQVDVIQSERVVMRALHAINADQDPELKDAWRRKTDGRGDFEAWLAEDAAKSLDAKPGKDSNVIAVSYTARDPVVAAKVANAVVKSYIETTLQLRTEPAKQFTSLFDESTKGLREALETAQTRLSRFQQSRGIVATDEKLDIENSRLSELSSQLVAMQAIATESQARQTQASVKGDQMQEVVGNQAISLLSADLARQQARLSEITERLGERNPQVVELRANINGLRSLLNVERARIAGGIGVNNVVNQSRLDVLKGEITAQRSRVLKMKGLRDEASVMLRDVENAQRAYDAAFARQKQSTLESQATQTNVSVLKYASPPPFPSSPRLIINGLVAIVFGVLVAVATALIRERRDWRLRAETDILEVMNQPLLGVLPKVSFGLTLPVSRSIRGVAARVLGLPRTLQGG